MPEELDADVRVVDSEPADDSNSSNSDSSSGSSSSSSSGKPDTLFKQYQDDNKDYQDKDADGTPDSLESSSTLTDQRDEDGYRKTESQVQEEKQKSSGSSGDSADVVLTDVQGEDGYRLTQEQLAERTAKGDTEGLSRAETSSSSNPDRNAIDTPLEQAALPEEARGKADAALTDVQGEQGFRLTAEQLQDRLREDETQDLTYAEHSSASAIIDSRRNRRKNILERRRENRSEDVRKDLREDFQQNDPLLSRLYEKDVVAAPRKDPIDGAVVDFFHPNRKVDENLNIAGEAVLAGQDIIRESQEFGGNVESQTPDFIGAGPGGLIAGSELVGRGEFEEAGETILLPGNQNELEKQRSKEFVSGVAAGPGTFAGFALGGTGAVGKATEQEIRELRGKETQGPGIGGSVLQGGEKIIGQVKEDPGGFAAQELGEETGEALGRGIVTGGVGAFAVTPNIEPSITISTPEKAQTAGRFVKGELGLRAEEPNVIGQTDDIALIKRQTQELEDSGRTQVVEGFTEESLAQGESVLFGERTEAPVSRTQFVKEKLGVSDAELADALPDLNTKRKGQFFLGQRVKTPSQTPETTPETEPNIDIDGDKLFRETPEPETKPFREEFDVRASRLTPGIEAGLEVSSQNQELDQGAGLDQDIIQEQQIVQDQEIGIENIVETRQEPLIDADLKQETTQERNQLERIIEPRIDRKPESSRKSLFSLESDEDQDEEISQDEISSEFEFRASVGAEILGITAEEAPSQEEVQDPLSLRPVVRDKREGNEDLFGL